MADVDKREKVEIELDFPVQLADRVLDKVTMRRPKMKDMLKHKIDLDMKVQDAANLIGDLCGLVPDEMEELDCNDFDKLQKQLLAFRGVAETE